MGAHRGDRKGFGRKPGRHAPDSPSQSRVHELGNMDRIALLGILTGLDHKNMPNKAKYATMSRDQIIAAILRLEGL